MKNKAILIMGMIIVLSLSIHTHVFGNQRTEIASDKLVEIMQVMDKNEIEMESWTLYSREFWGTLNEPELMERFKEIQINAKQFDWSITEDPEKWKAVGTLQTNSSTTEKLILLAHPHKDKMQTYFIYEVNGKEWDQNIQSDFFPSLTERAASFFRGTAESFACVSGLTSDKMEGVLYNHGERLLKDFQAKKIESLTEETFVSLSAYNEKWKNDIPVKDGAMNLQIALRQGLGGATSVTIGTPIITSEY